MLGEEAPALRQCHGMREDAVDFADRSSGDGDQVVADAQQRLPLHHHIVREQQVEVLGDGAGQRVLNGNDGGGTDPLATAAKASAESEKGTMTASARGSSQPRG
jgi:hypothetical protein